MEYRVLGKTGVQVSRLGLGAMVHSDTLDRIDAIVAPGVDLDPADRGWDPPSLQPVARRRR